METSCNGYCICCGLEQECLIFRNVEKISVRDIQFKYVKKIAVCRECGNEVYIPWINDENAKSREFEYSRVIGKEYGF